MSLWSAISRLGQRFHARTPAADKLPRPVPEQITQCTLLELALESDSVIAFEVREGCVAEADERLDTLRQKIAGSRPACTGSALDGETLDRLWVNLLHLGLLDELRYLAGPPCNLPFRSEVKAFLDHGAVQFAACQARGAAYRAQHPGVEIFTMGCIVWGEEYIRNFLRYNVRSMLSEDNLPALVRQGKVVFSIVTNAAGEQQLRSDWLFAKLSEIADVEFTVVPDSLIEILRHGHLVRNFYVLYGMLDHCSIYFAEGAGSHLFMIPVDCVVASGTLPNMANYRHQGYEC